MPAVASGSTTNIRDVKQNQNSTNWGWCERRLNAADQRCRELRNSAQYHLRQNRNCIQPSLKTPLMPLSKSAIALQHVYALPNKIPVVINMVM